VLLAEDPESKKDLKKYGWLERDSRKKERKHFGFRKARKRKQWKKR
jgi:small subunit ribosomal protein S9